MLCEADCFCVGEVFGYGFLGYASNLRSDSVFSFVINITYLCGERVG